MLCINNSEGITFRHKANVFPEFLKGTSKRVARASCVTTTITGEGNTTQLSNIYEKLTKYQNLY
jgi:hypothetical protein